MALLMSACGSDDECPSDIRLEQVTDRRCDDEHLGEICRPFEFVCTCKPTGWDCVGGKPPDLAMRLDLSELD
jgi:hypothetical protein